jgi:heat shock protein HslJ
MVSDQKIAERALESGSGQTSVHGLIGFLCATILLMAGCAPVHSPKSISSTKSQRETSASGFTLDQLRNATYRGIYDRAVTLTDGQYDGAPFQPGGAARPRVVLASNLVARGDLDGDGGEEAVVLLAANSGASGTFDYLAVVAAQDGKPVNVATESLGDRVQLRSLRILDGQLMVDLVAHGSDDAMCCPTLKVRRTLTLSGDRLIQVRREELGPIAVADLAGVTWMLEEISFAEPVPAEPAITLRIDQNQIVGTAGCNNYFAPYSSEGPGKLKVALSGSTRKACSAPIMDLEARYLKALENVVSYSFLAGRLALTYRRDGNFATLLFASRANLRAD